MATRKKIENIDDLTEGDVWDILKFADNLSLNIYGNAITPMLLNSRLKDITMNPMQATEQGLNEAMRDPKNSELQLMGFSEDFENTSQVYKRLISYMSDMAAFDITYTSTNAKFSDYKSPSYNKDLDVVKEFLDNFDYKKEFRIAVREMLRNEAFFCSPRFDAKKLVLQELPSSPTYTMITGRWEYGILFDFNLYWMLQPGVVAKYYSRFFQEKFYNLFKDGGIYDPTLNPLSRGDTRFVYWQSVPPDEGHCFKLNPEIATRIPYFAPLFMDLVQQPLMRALQKNINMSVAARLILGQVGTLKDTGAKLKDQFNISPDILGKFLSLVKTAVGESLKVAGAPLENMQAISFPAENGLYQSYLKNSLATSGINTSLIFTSDVRPNIFESQASLGVDMQFITALYPQFNAFLNYHINQRTKKYKFNFEFEGTNFYYDRQQRLDTAIKLASQGMVLPQKVSAAVGMNPFSFQRQLEEARATGFVDNLTPIVPNFQTSKENQKNGRPQKDISEISEGGEETRTNGNNIDKGGSI